MAGVNQAILPLDDYVAACDATRAKGGTTSAAIKSGELAGAIRAIPGPKPEQEKSATAVKNGPVVLTPDNGKVLSKATVTVAVPSDKKPEETFAKEYTANGTYTVSPTAGHVFSGGTVKVSTPVKKPEQTKSVTYTTNGKRTVSPDSGKVLTGVTVDVQVPSKKPVVQALSVTENKTYNPPAGVDGFAPVTVNVPTGGGGGKSFTIVQFEDADSEGAVTVLGSNEKWEGPGYMTDYFVLANKLSNITVTSENQAAFFYTSYDYDMAGLILTCGSDQFDVFAITFENGAYKIDYSGGAYYAPAEFTSFVIYPKMDGAVAASLAIGASV